jgi:hypothetical protein
LLAFFAPTPRHCALAQPPLMRGPTVVYYNGYGQGYYGGYAPNYGSQYLVVPNNGYPVYGNGYSGYGNGPYGNYRGYGNPGYYNPYYNRTYRQSYRMPARYVYYGGF